MIRVYFLFTLLTCVLGFSFDGEAQQTAKMTSGGTGYLEKLPPDYVTNSTRKYPVIFFLHGSGETGNGSPSDLNKVKAHGIPKIIEGGHNMCFNVNGVDECFIVISPQLGNQGGWWPSILNDVFNYVLSGPQNYRIDLNRVYLTGLSLGGWGVYIGGGDPAVADIFAAIAPVSGFGNGNGCSISARKLPAWGFHGENDGTIPYGTGLTEFSRIGWCTTPVPTAELKWTSYPGQGHDIWENFAYRTDNTLHNPNLYQWFLSKSKNNLPSLVVNNPPPVCSPATVDLTASSITAGSTSGMTFTYWTDVAASNSYTTPAMATTGTYYIKGTLGAAIDIKPITVIVNSKPTVNITNPAAICPSGTANLTTASITAGSSSNLIFTFWTDSNATISYSTPSAASIGTYFIKGIATTGCYDIKPIIVSANPVPTVAITNPPSVCPSINTNITAASITAGSITGLTFSYWTNSTATTALSTPTAVGTGIYYIKGTNSFGCFDVKPITVSQFIAPALTIINPSAVCTPATIDLTATAITAGSSPSLVFTYWLDSNASSSYATPTTATVGTYYIKATNANSCSTTKPVVVSITPTPIVTITNPAAICSPGTVDLTITSITSGSSPASLTYTYWANSIATIPLATPTSLTAGIYYIKGTNAGDCFDIKPVSVTVNPLPTLVIKNPSAVCFPAAIDLTSPAITSGSSSGLIFSYWTNSLATTQLANASTVNTSGTFYIKGTDSNNCSNVAEVSTTRYDQPVLTVSPLNSAVCSASATNIQLSTFNSVPSIFNWSASAINGNVSGFSGGNGSPIVQSPTTDNMGGVIRYTVQAISNIGNCTSASITTDVQVAPVPTASINTLASTSVICNGCTTNIIIQNPNNVTGTTFSWASSILSGSVNGYASGTGTNINQALTKISTSGSVRYTITPKAGTCEGTPITFDVRLNNPPIANAGGNLTITLPTNSLTPNGSANDADGTIASIVWSKIAGPASFSIKGESTLTPTISNLVEGIYQFRLLVQDNDDAIGLNTMTLIVKPKANTPPFVSAGADLMIKLPKNQVTIKGTATDSDGTIKSSAWSQVSGRKATMTTNENDLTVMDLLQGTYTFRFSATDNSDATEHADINVTVLADDNQPPFTRKKFITPNGDNSNDKWVLDPDITRYEFCKLIILSNAGQKIFEIIGYQNDWDGTHDGRSLPQDVYYYLCDCGSKKETGSITIIR